MKEINVTCWEEFEEKIKCLEDERIKRLPDAGYISDFVFRGESDSSWTLQTTLERYTKKSYALTEYYRIIERLKSQIETYTGHEWDIPSNEKYFEQFHDQKLLRPKVFLDLGYEYFIYLRHHGFPSPLLDWTGSQYIAAYFAFRKILEDVEKVSIYAFCEYNQNGKLNSSNEPSITGFGHYVKSHKRHFQQQSQYTVCTIFGEGGLTYAHHNEVFARNNEEQDALYKFNIPSSERTKVLKKLEKYNINAYSLFGSEESLMETLAIRMLSPDI
jgi:hypothetical protein